MSRPFSFQKYLRYMGRNQLKSIYTCHKHIYIVFIHISVVIMYIPSMGLCVYVYTCTHICIENIHGILI
jgi:uncharacterized membrane protein